jgi:hypothetical protein
LPPTSKKRAENFVSFWSIAEENLSEKSETRIEPEILFSHSPFHLSRAKEMSAKLAANLGRAQPDAPSVIAALENGHG